METSLLGNADWDSLLKIQGVPWKTALHESRPSRQFNVVGVLAVSSKVFGRTFVTGLLMLGTVFLLVSLIVVNWQHSMIRSIIKHNQISDTEQWKYFIDLP